MDPRSIPFKRYGVGLNSAAAEPRVAPLRRFRLRLFETTHAEASEAANAGAEIHEDDAAAEPLRVHVETASRVVGCAGCGTRAWLKDRRPVALVDPAAFGRPAVLVWHKRRWRCPELSCEIGTFTEQQPAIAAALAGVTDRAGRWMTRQVGGGRAVSAVASELGCDMAHHQRHCRRLWDCARQRP